MGQKKGGGKQVLPNGRFGYPNGQDFPPNEMKGNDRSIIRNYLGPVLFPKGIYIYSTV